MPHTSLSLPSHTCLCLDLAFIKFLQPVAHFLQILCYYSDRANRCTPNAIQPAILHTFQMFWGQHVTMSIWWTLCSQPF